MTMSCKLISRFCPRFFLLVVFCGLISVSFGQSDLGLPTFGSIHQGLYDAVKLSSGAVLLSIPVRNKTGFSYSLASNIAATIRYDGFLMYPAWSGGATPSPATVALFTTDTEVNCPGTQTKTDKYTGWYFIDQVGTRHLFPSIVVDVLQCLTYDRRSGMAIDGSGYTMVVAGDGSSATVYDRAGNTYGPGLAMTSITDPNGNVVSYSVSYSNISNGGCNYIKTFTYQDTLLTHPMTEAQTIVNCSTAPVGDVHTWNDAANNPQSYTFNYSNYTIKTNFGCPYLIDEPATPTMLPSSITAPDGTYTITYESTPGGGGITGRISKITFPSGAYIQYQFSGGPNNSGLVCDINYNLLVPLLTRTLVDSKGTSRVWTYDTQSATNSTVVTDPSGNDTVYLFSMTGTARTDYETQRQSYQGHRVGGTLLRTEVTCYNNNTSNCPVATITGQILEKDIYTSLPGMSSSSHVWQAYDTFGDVTEIKTYGFGATSPISDTVVAYGTYNNSNGQCTAIGSYINRVCSTTTKAGTSTLSQVNNTYDSKGNLTSVSRWVSGPTGSSGLYLTSSTSYNSNGTVNVTQDVNGAPTTYHYDPNVCNNLLPTSISEPLGLSRSMTWDCNGGVVKIVTDENLQPTTYGYVNLQTGSADPFYRPISITDPVGNITNFTYTPTTFESAMNFSTVSTVDTLTTSDGFGHQLLAQQRQGQGSSSFDTTQYKYDASFRLSSVSVPCPTQAGNGCSTPVTTTTYDGLSRPLQVTDGGGGYTSYNYAPAGSYNNDVLVTLGPAPTVPATENTKRRQLEYDGLGRLASVCELTTATNGGGTCAQTSAQTGYWTKYAYDGLNRLTGVTQNVQGTAQTRSYGYDGLSRLISETNPEWGPGTAAYVYDSDASGNCPGSYKGDLVKRTDNAGNVSCYAYDGLHRELSTTYSGPNTTTNRYFVYDAATVNGQGMPNAKARMAEAYTATCSTCSKVTDEGFGYTVRGELQDFYESTPHSAGYYHVPMTYWANGLIETFGPFLTEDQTGYVPDGEGRASAVHDFYNGSNPVPSITYNSASEPTQLMTSCVGTTCYPISYQYDPNTLRMTQYSAALNGGTISGSLTWNPNGSLQKLVIADPFNAADAQTCTYGADDLSRIASANCGSAWAQTFTYDPFGNLTKSGSSSWSPGYNSSTNRYALGGTSYDSNGNVLNDTFNTYAWDAEGKPLSTAYSLSGQTFTFVYDAFGHKVEWSLNGTYEDSYVTLGQFKLRAVGQTADYSQFPIPGRSILGQLGGGTGVQLGDWLGTSRAFWSYTGGTWGQSGAHAPFGESYAFNGGYPTAFTGQDNDHSMINTTYYFPERQYRSAQGRWLSPDPAGIGAADPTNPQSWNRYAYVLNNPLRSIDPTGTECVWDDGSYDSNDDAQTGNYGDCNKAGGTWVDHSYFQDQGQGDWSGDPNADIAGYAASIATANSTATCPSVPGGSLGASEVANNVAHWNSTQSQLNASGTNASSLAFGGMFLGSVLPYGSNDYKNKASAPPSLRTAQFGNFNFGSLCYNGGFSLEDCQRGAGAAAYLSATLNVAEGRNWTAGPGRPFGDPATVGGVPVYGDQIGPNENDAVISGWAYQQSKSMGQCQ